MIHIELVTGDEIKVKETIADVANMSGPVVRLTMVTSKQAWSKDGKSIIMGEIEQKIYLREDKIVYFYEI